MKKRIILASFLLLAFIAGCGGGEPKESMQIINNLLAKKFDMTDTQRNDVKRLVEEGKKLKAENKNAEAEKALAEAIKILKYAEEADRFNKSE